MPITTALKSTEISDENAYVEMLRAFVAQNGKFSQKLGDAGIGYINHVVIGDTAKFYEFLGEICKNCTFYKKEFKECEIVEGHIDPLGLCGLGSWTDAEIEYDTFREAMIAWEKQKA